MSRSKVNLFFSQFSTHSKLIKSIGRQIRFYSGEMFEAVSFINDFNISVVKEVKELTPDKVCFVKGGCMTDSLGCIDPILFFAHVSLHRKTKHWIT